MIFQQFTGGTSCPVAENSWHLELRYVAIAILTLASMIFGYLQALKKSGCGTWCEGHVHISYIFDISFLVASRCVTFSEKYCILHVVEVTSGNLT